MQGRRHGGQKGRVAPRPLNAILASFPVCLEPQDFFQRCRRVTSSLKTFECGFGLLDQSNDVCVV